MNTSDRIIQITDCDGDTVAEGIARAGHSLNEQAELLADSVSYPTVTLPELPDWTGVKVWGDGDYIVSEIPEEGRLDIPFIVDNDGMACEMAEPVGTDRNGNLIRIGDTVLYPKEYGLSEPTEQGTIHGMSVPDYTLNLGGERWRDSFMVEKVAR